MSGCVLSTLLHISSGLLDHPRQTPETLGSNAHLDAFEDTQTSKKEEEVVVGQLRGYWTVSEHWPNSRGWSHDLHKMDQ